VTHLRQSRLDFGLGFQVKSLECFELYPIRSEAVWGGIYGSLFDRRPLISQVYTLVASEFSARVQDPSSFSRPLPLSLFLPRSRSPCLFPSSLSLSIYFFRSLAHSLIRSLSLSLNVFLVPPQVYTLVASEFSNRVQDPSRDVIVTFGTTWSTPTQ